MSGRREAKRVSGLRVALVVYLLIVISGLGASGAQALWKLSGSASGTVTAGSWAPKSIDGNSVQCARQDGSTGGSSYTDLKLSWPAVDADSYQLALTGNGMNLKDTTGAPNQTFRLPKPGLFGTHTYTVSITPVAGSGDATRAGQSVNISARINFSILTSVKCSETN